MSDSIQPENDSHGNRRKRQSSATQLSASRSKQWLVFVTSLCAAIALLIVGSTLIRTSAAQNPRPPAANLPMVDTLVLKRLDAYDVLRVYAAQIEPNNQVLLSFETGGTLIDVAANEGELVTKGDVIARLDTRLLEARRAQLSASRRVLDSDAELADLELARQRRLSAEGFAASEALDHARVATKRVAARIAEADAGLTLVDVELDKAVLRAPFDAIVGERHLDSGAQVAASSPVLHLLQTNAPRLRVGLPPARAAVLDQTSIYSFRAGATQIKARLISRRADINTRTRTVSALFEPIDAGAEALFFGQLLEFTITDQVPGEVYNIPLSALAEDEHGLWSVMAVSPVNLANGDHQREARLQRIAVKVVHVSGESAFVAGMLDGNERIVADGRHRVVDGERVRTDESVNRRDA